MSTSALYVVDLKKFRKIAAGDRLRGQYQALSQDPNSLSNLDQVTRRFLSALTTLKQRLFLPYQNNVSSDIFRISPTT